jgi:(S)-ureidoglycine aminohydrolase
MRGDCARRSGLGRAFYRYTAEFETGGELGGTNAQRFVFIMEGAVKLDVHNKQSELGARGYAYVPAGLVHRITATQKSRVAVIEKTYGTLETVQPPRLIVSHEDSVASHPLGDDPALQVKCLLPDEMSFDFAINTRVYQPGAALSIVEMHVMEHGLIMLEGGGIYRLGDSWYPVTAGILSGWDRLGARSGSERSEVPPSILSTKIGTGIRLPAHENEAPSSRAQADS